MTHPVASPSLQWPLLATLVSSLLLSPPPWFVLKQIPRVVSKRLSEGLAAAQKTQVGHHLCLNPAAPPLGINTQPKSLRIWPGCWPLRPIHCLWGPGPAKVGWVTAAEPVSGHTDVPARGAPGTGPGETRNPGIHPETSGGQCRPLGRPAQARFQDSAQRLLQVRLLEEEPVCGGSQGRRAAGSGEAGRVLLPEISLLPPCTARRGLCGSNS